MSDAPCYATLVEAAAAIRDKEISSVELTRACLARIEAAQPRLNAFIHIEAEQALAMAAERDAELARGEIRGPLHGVPLAHKDCYYRAGVLSTCGSRIRAQFVPETTATVLERIDAAGAVDLGGLHMTEWAMGPTGHNVHFGPCRNPWNPEHTPGGSSSGSAAAVADRLVFAALGSDVGGSIRLPAAACGVVGIKPTHTRVSRAGAMAMCYSLEHVGPLARTAADAARMLAVVAGHDPRDPASSRLPVPDYEAGLARGIEGFRIGVPRGDDPTLDPQVAERLRESLEVLRSLGAEPVEVTLPDLDALDRIANVVMAVELAAVHGNQLRAQPEDYSDQVRHRIEPGFHIPGSRYLEALHLRARCLAELCEGPLAAADALHVPMFSFPVPTLAATDVGGAPEMPALITSIIRRTRPFSYLGVPAVSVPAGFTGNGLPAAFQLVGRPFAEGKLLRIAHAYQQATDWHRRAPAR